MFSYVKSVTLCGLDGVMVNVETDAGDGLPVFEMSGFLAAQVRESKERIKVAIKNSGYAIRPQRIIVNISPADIRKSGTGFDLPIAIGILISNGILTRNQLEETVVLGELSLDGKVNGIRGVLSCVMAAKSAGVKRCIVPSANLWEGQLVDGIEVYGVDSLRQLVDFFNDNSILSASRPDVYKLMNSHNNELDYGDIKGQLVGKRACMIAVAGLHNLMLIGTPGSGKTMMAKRLPTIMPELTFQEMLELTKIYSIAGLLNDKSVIATRPYRSPHHSVTLAGMLGGGNNPKPGEITLANGGVLFLDEFTEYPIAVLESLRQPLEDRKIHLIRAGAECVYPCDFMLVAAMNPCKCGFYPDRTRCFCTEHDIARYMGRISRPIWDRFDMSVKVDTIDYSVLGYEDYNDGGEGEKYNSSYMKQRVDMARERQLHRFRDTEYSFNSQIPSRRLKEYCYLNSESKKLLEAAYNKLNMTARGYERVLKTARTIADIEDSEDIKTEHMSEAISYRNTAF